jgi:uncharacterized protein
MPITTSAVYRPAAIAVVAAALLAGAFGLGASRGGSAGSGPADAAVTTASVQAGRITVTGNGTVTGVPNQLSLSLSVQVNSYSVSSALSQADQAVRQVTRALSSRGVAPADIQTSDLTIQPNYANDSGVPASYGVSESLTATLNDLATAGTQISAAVRAGGNAVSVSGVALNLTDTGSLMAAARARAVADAHAQAKQFAAALGEPLGQVVSVTPVTEQTPLPTEFGSAAGRSSSVPVSPGTQQVTVSITVVYAV